MKNGIVSRHSLEDGEGWDKEMGKWEISRVRMTKKKVRQQEKTEEVQQTRER